MSEHQNTCAQRYDKLASDKREVFLERARECAKLTIPTLFPETGHTKSTSFKTPYQGIGARGVNNLASKLLLSLFPPNSPFFAMRVDDFTAQELAQEEGARAKVDEALNKYERAVMQEIENTGDRAGHFEALKHLIVGGNVLLQVPKDGKTRVHSLENYVVVRDPQGTVLEIIIKEELSYGSLPEDIQEMIREQIKENGQIDLSKEVAIYTKVILEGKQYTSYQEVMGQRVKGSEGKWPKDKSPFIALRWTTIDGEDYGRGYVEEYFGDLKAIEGLSKAILEGSAAAARVLFLVNPNGTTRAKDITQAPNGAAVAGRDADVTTLQVQKQADMQVAMNTMSTITERLAYAFLMNSAIQRQGERVTAEEVRYMAGELEDALGGVYSILSQEYQLPYVQRVIARMTTAKKLPKLPEGVTQPVITTGLEALGRGHDLNKYDMFLKALMPLGPEVLSQYMNVGDYITRIGTSLGIDLDGLVKDAEQLAAEQEAAQQQQMQQQMMEMAKPAVGPVAKEGAQALREASQTGGQ